MIKKRIYPEDVIINIGEYDKATESYLKSISLNVDSPSKEKLKNLSEK